MLAHSASPASIPSPPQVAAELRDLRVNSLTSGAQPTFLAQMLTLPKGRIVERIIESATSLNFVNALLFSCVIQARVGSLSAGGSHSLPRARPPPPVAA